MDTSLNDQILRAHLPRARLQLIVVHSTALSRYARQISGSYPTAAGLFAQTLTAGLLLGTLQKGDARLNLQIECDGPVRGLFADATPSGEVRGYVRNPEVDFPGRPGPFRANGALGRRGYVSVLRDLNGEIYRGAVDLDATSGQPPELPELLERYFAQSEQVDTAVALSVQPQAEEQLGRVAGLLVQPMPDGDREAFKVIAQTLRSGWLDQALLSAGAGVAWLAPLCGGEEPRLVDEHPAVYRCGCSKDRAVRALLAMGREEIVDLWEKEGKAEAKCEFCRTVYVIPGEELIRLVFPTGVDRN